MAAVLGIDYGLKRTGLALTDDLAIVASALETVATHDLPDVVDRLIKQKGIQVVVVGQPRRWSGELSDVESHIAGFVKRLKSRHDGLEVVRQDERFTSMLAQRTILEAGANKKKRQDKGLVDKVSATLILQAYLESRMI